MTALGQDKPGTSVCLSRARAGWGQGGQGRELSLDFGSKCGKKGEAVARRCLVILCWVPAAQAHECCAPLPARRSPLLSTPLSSTR